MRLEYATPVPREGHGRPLVGALAALCLLAGVPLCSIGALVLIAINRTNEQEFSVGLTFLIFGAVFCFFGLRLRRHLKRRWVRGIYIPDIYLSTVRLLRTAFANGLAIDSPDYTAICLFLDHEGCTARDIAHMLVFSFDIEYAHAINALESMETDPTPAQTIARMEQRLTPHGLQTWRTER